MNLAPGERAFFRVVIDADDQCDGCGPTGRGLFGLCIFPGAGGGGRGTIICTTCLHLGIGVVDDGRTVRVPSLAARAGQLPENPG